VLGKGMVDWLGNVRLGISVVCNLKQWLAIIKINFPKDR